MCYCLLRFFWRLGAQTKTNKSDAYLAGIELPIVRPTENLSSIGQYPHYELENEKGGEDHSDIKEVPACIIRIVDIMPRRRSKDHAYKGFTAFGKGVNPRRHLQIPKAAPSH